MKFILALCILFSCSLIWSQAVIGQTENDRTARESQSKIKWLDALNVRVITEGNDRIHYLSGNVELRQDSTYFFADSAVLRQNLLYATGNVVIVRGDSLTIFGDTLNYDGNLRYGYLTGESFIEQGGSLLYSKFLEYDAHNNIAYYQRRAVLTDGDFQLTSRKGTYNLNTERILFRDSVEILGEDFFLRTDSLEYDTESSTAYFIAPTLIRQGDGRIYTEGGHYNLATGDAVFFDNPQYKKEGELARADTMVYNDREESLLLIDRVFYQKDSLEITSDRLFYDIPGDEVTITGNAVVTEGSREIKSDKIIYDLEQGRFYTVGRAFVKEEKYEMEADSLFYGENEGEGFAFGRVIWKDTDSGMWMESEEAVFSDSTGAVKAYGGRPLMVYPSDTDSLFLTADTIFSRNFYTETDTHRITQAYYNVKIFRKDFQAVCDSLAHLEQDSLFRMMYDPVIWMDTTQLVGDTIDAFLKDGTISSAFIRRNAMVLTSPDSIYFNQMKGREITARFKDGVLNRVHVNGNAEALYFPLDESNAYIGINKSESSEIRIDLRENTVTDIRFYGRPSSSLTPMHKATSGQFRLEGFRWQAERRPRSVEDLKKPVPKQDEILFIQPELESYELTAPEPSNR
jgi:lipopolysaccharide assembly outer membrane protein LptD (OstA)